MDAILLERRCLDGGHYSFSGRSLQITGRCLSGILREVIGLLQRARQEDTPLVGTREATHANSTGRLASQDEGTGRATWEDLAVRLGEFTTSGEQSVTVMSHPCTDGVIGARHH